MSVLIKYEEVTTSTGTPDPGHPTCCATTAPRNRDNDNATQVIADSTRDSNDYHVRRVFE
jgi:hypothetical protein